MFLLTEYFSLPLNLPDMRNCFFKNIFFYFLLPAIDAYIIIMVPVDIILPGS